MAQAIEQSLMAAEDAVAAGASLAGTGFWSAVATVKTDSELVDRYANRIASIDEAAFEQWAWIKVPLGVGTVLALLATVAGAVLIGIASSQQELTAVVYFFAGVAVLLTTTHGLGHLVVGMLTGIRFTRWFVGSPKMPQPGVKVDYSTYLRSSPARRAWMHASGAIVTKILPFALLPAALSAGLPTWSIWILVGLGLGMLTTDILWSTKSSDWKKFKREVRSAQPS